MKILQKNVCVIGADICSNLFGEDSETGKPINAIGKTININYILFSDWCIQKMETEAERKAEAQLKVPKRGPKEQVDSVPEEVVVLATEILFISP